MGAYNPLTVRGSLRCAVRKAIISLSDGSARNQSAGDFSFERWQQSRRRTWAKVLTQKKATKEVQKGATKEPQKKATKEVQKGATKEPQKGARTGLQKGVRTELHKGARKGLQKGARKAPSKKKKRLTSRQTKPSSTRKRSSKHRKRSASTRRRSRNGRGSNHRRRSAYKRSYKRSTRGQSARRIQKGSRMRAQEYEAIESYGDRENIEMLLGESTRQVHSTRRRKEKATEEESTYANAKLDLRELNRAEAFKLLKETAAVMVV